MTNLEGRLFSNYENAHATAAIGVSMIVHSGVYSVWMAYSDKVMEKDMPLVVGVGAMLLLGGLAVLTIGYRGIQHYRRNAQSQ